MQSEMIDPESGAAMKIAVVAPSMEMVGGQSVQANELIHALQRVGHEAFLIPVNPSLPAIVKRLAKMKGMRTLLNQAVYLPSLLRGIPRAEVVHIFSASYFSFLLSPVPAITAGRLLKKRVVLNYHSGEAEDHLRRWGWLIRPLIRMADVIVVPSHYLERVFHTAGYDALVVPNIANLDHFNYRQRATLHPRLISTRNLEPIYDVENTLYAFCEVQKRYPDARLDIVGSGSQLEMLRSMASRLNLKGVSFSGCVERKNIPKHYDSADIFVNSSLIDNQPMSILEAFASGLPVVTTGIGGIPDLVTDGITGLLVEPQKPHRMADKIIGLLENPLTGLEYAGNAYQICERFRWERVVASMEAIYQGETPEKGWKAPVTERHRE